MISMLQDMIAIPSFRREEKAVVDYLYACLANLDMPVHRVGNNLWCSTEGDGPVLLLNAHVDTVKPAARYTRDPVRPC